MLLPTFIVSYATALLSAPWRFTLVYLSMLSGISHDVFTRGLRKRYPWKAIFRLFVTGVMQQGGYLIVDETDIDKTFARNIPCLSWIFSNRKKKYIFGLHLVVIVWTNDVITVPIAWKIYQKESGETKIDLALELIAYCLGSLGMHPTAILFDAFYAAEKVLKFLSAHNQIFYSQLPKNRLFDHEPLARHNNGRPYWMKTGYIKGTMKVQIVKNRRKYYITNAIGVTRQKQLGTYKLRWRIEEVFRFVKKELGLERCQVTSLQGQQNHFGVCFYLYAQLQDIAQKTGLTDYALKMKATRDASFVKQIDLSVYMSSA